MCVCFRFLFFLRAFSVTGFCFLHAQGKMEVCEIYTSSHSQWLLPKANGSQSISTPAPSLCRRGNYCTCYALAPGAAQGLSSRYCLDKLLNNGHFIGSLPFPPFLSHFPTGISCCHLPSELFPLKFLSQGLLLGTPKLRNYVPFILAYLSIRAL